MPKVKRTKQQEAELRNFALSLDLSGNLDQNADEIAYEGFDGLVTIAALRQKEPDKAKLAGDMTLILQLVNMRGTLISKVIKRMSDEGKSRINELVKKYGIANASQGSDPTKISASRIASCFPMLTMKLCIKNQMRDLYPSAKLPRCLRFNQAPALFSDDTYKNDWVEWSMVTGKILKPEDKSNDEDRRAKILKYYAIMRDSSLLNQAQKINAMKIAARAIKEEKKNRKQESEEEESEGEEEEDEEEEESEENEETGSKDGSGDDEGKEEEEEEEDIEEKGEASIEQTEEQRQKAAEDFLKAKAEEEEKEIKNLELQERTSFKEKKVRYPLRISSVIDAVKGRRAMNFVGFKNAFVEEVALAMSKKQEYIYILMDDEMKVMFSDEEPVSIVDEQGNLTLAGQTMIKTFASGQRFAGDNRFISNCSYIISAARLSMADSSDEIKNSSLRKEIMSKLLSDRSARAAHSSRKSEE